MSKERIIFKNNSIIVEYYDSYEKRFISENLNLSTKTINDLWDFEVEFSKSLTIEGFLKQLRPYLLEIQNHLNPFINKINLSEFFDLLDKPADDIVLNPKLKHIEMYWSSYIWEVTDELNEKTDSEFEIFGSYEAKPLNNNSDSVSLSLTPLNNWKHIKFVLKKDFSCYKHSENGEKELLFSSTNIWTLHDLLKFFFYELTFYGSLQDMEEFKRSLDEFDSETVMEGYSLISINDFELKNLEKQLEELVKNEDYEQAAIIRNKINKLRNNLQDN
jgi:hypothetical protein